MRRAMNEMKTHKSALTMRLKSQQQSTNQRPRTHVHASPVLCPAVMTMVMICLLTKAAAGYVTPATEAKQRTASQWPDKVSDDCDTLDDVYHRPHFTNGRSVMVQLFEWKFEDVAEECRTFLGPKGYAGVQLSPVLEHTLIKTDAFNHPWWQRYETVSYRLASRSGDESDFWSMSRICNDHGVRIYVDVVLNHMAAPLHLLLNASTATATATEEDFVVNTLLSADVNISDFSYPNVPYAAKDFHRPCAMDNVPNAHAMRNCQLNGHPDLDHSQAATVQQPIVEMLNKFIDMGVAGFRIDAAKHMWPIELKQIYGQLKDLSNEFNFEDKARPFIYHDVFDMGLDAISKTEYTTYGVVSEYLYAAELSTILHGRAPLSSLINWGPAMGFVPHQDSLVFIDTHDTQRGLPRELGNNRMVTYKLRHKYIMANALMLAYPYGRIKRIMSSYYFDESNINQGPPSDESDENVIRSPQFNGRQQCTASSGWVCEHRWPALVQLVAMANYFSVAGQEEESVIHFQTNGPNHIAFCRGHKAFVAMNNDPERDFVKEVFTCLEEGVYCDVITGGLKEGGQECQGRSLEVNAEGYAQLNLAVDDDNMGESEGFKFAAIEEEVEEEEADVVESFGVLVVYVGSKVGMEGGVEELWLGNEGNNEVNGAELGEGLEEKSESEDSGSDKEPEVGEGLEEKSECEDNGSDKEPVGDQPEVQEDEVAENGEAGEEAGSEVEQNPGNEDKEPVGDQPEVQEDEVAENGEDGEEPESNGEQDPGGVEKEPVGDQPEVQEDEVAENGEVGDETESEIEQNPGIEEVESAGGDEPIEGNTEDEVEEHVEDGSENDKVEGGEQDIGDKEVEDEGANEPAQGNTGSEIVEHDEGVVESDKEENVEDPAEGNPEEGAEEQIEDMPGNEDEKDKNPPTNEDEGNDEGLDDGNPSQKEGEGNEEGLEDGNPPTNEGEGNEEGLEDDNPPTNEGEGKEEGVEVDDGQAEGLEENAIEDDQEQSQIEGEENGEDVITAEGGNDSPDEGKSIEDNGGGADVPETQGLDDPGEAINEEANNEEKPDEEAQNDEDVVETDHTEVDDNQENNEPKAEGEEENEDPDKQQTNEEASNPKQTERALEKIDKRQTDDENDGNLDQQVEQPATTKDEIELEVEDNKELEQNIDDPESNTQETSRTSTVEIINQITELQLPANDSKAAVKTEEVVVAAGIYPSSQKRQGNG